MHFRVPTLLSRCHTLFFQSTLQSAPLPKYLEFGSANQAPRLCLKLLCLLSATTAKLSTSSVKGPFYREEFQEADGVISTERSEWKYPCGNFLKDFSSRPTASLEMTSQTTSLARCNISVQTGISPLKKS